VCGAAAYYLRAHAMRVRHAIDLEAMNGACLPAQLARHVGRLGARAQTRLLAGRNAPWKIGATGVLGVNDTRMRHAECRPRGGCPLWRAVPGQLVRRWLTRSLLTAVRRAARRGERHARAQRGAAAARAREAAAVQHHAARVVRRTAPWLRAAGWAGWAEQRPLRRICRWRALSKACGRCSGC